MILILSLFVFSHLFCQTYLQEFNLTKDYELFFDSLFKNRYKQLGISSLAISLIHKNQTVLFKGYGYESIKDEKHTTEDTVFQLGSISTTFLSFGTIKKFPDLNFTKKVNDYLPNLVKIRNEIVGNYVSHGGVPLIDTKKEVEIHHLFTHSAGFDPQIVSGVDNKKSDEVVLQKFLPPRIRHAGVIPMYNDFEACVLANIVAGNESTYSEFLNETFFYPLEMTNTYYGYDETVKKENICDAAYYDLNEHEFTLYPTNIQNFGCKASTQIYSSSKDMQKYLKVYLTHEVESSLFYGWNEAVFESRFKVGQMEMSMNFLKDSIGDVNWDFQSGNVAPFRSEIMINFENEIAIIVLLSGSEKSKNVGSIIRKEFSLEFLVNSSFIESSNGVLVEDEDFGHVYKRKLALELWNREESKNYYNEKYKNYFGCYINSNYSHTGWHVILKFSQVIPHDSFCIELYKKQFLRLQYYPYSGSSTIILLLENLDPNSSEDDFLYAEYDKDEEIVLIDYISEKYTFLYDSSTRKYWINSFLGSSYEFYKENTNSVNVAMIFEFYILEVYFPVIFFIALFASLMIPLPFLSWCTWRLSQSVSEDEKDLKVEEVEKKKEEGSDSDSEIVDVIEIKIDDIPIPKIDDKPIPEVKPLEEAEMKIRADELSQTSSTASITDKEILKYKEDSQDRRRLVSIALSLICYTLITISIVFNIIHYFVIFDSYSTILYGETQSLVGVFDVVVRLPVFSLVFMFLSTLFIVVFLYHYIIKTKFKVNCKSYLDILRFIHVISVPIYFVLTVILNLWYIVVVSQLNLFVHNVSS